MSPAASWTILAIALVVIAGLLVAVARYPTAAERKDLGP